MVAMVRVRGAATDSGPPGQHIHSGPPGGGGLYIIEIAIAFPSQSFFPLLPNQIILFQLLKSFSFVWQSDNISFCFFYKVNLERRLEHFFCSLNTFFLS